MKLNNGWKSYGPACIHPKGFKVHTLGYFAWPWGHPIICASDLPYRDDVDHAIRIQGGNRKRGLMLWAQQVYRFNEEVEMAADILAVETAEIQRRAHRHPARCAGRTLRGGLRRGPRGTTETGGRHSAQNRY